MSRGDIVIDIKTYNKYLNILKEELVPALGYTEPIAIAYASVKDREVMGNSSKKY
ncbi:hypothetical protein [Lutispora sp.]|uniref:hypothetical protein n=1 Tax=Lutispora sp. TaxID=2828727 RepID=UPI002B212242|nr:hypothetical protein [Lutispora sp.]MEA4960570.1 hypothetical protein [Lutispora sp.]